MNYSRSEFFDLMEKVEEQGGEHLDRVHEPREYSFTGDKLKPVTIGNCGNSAIFRVPYDAMNKAGDEIGVHPVEVCAVDDDMGRWPRFGGDRFGR